MRKIIIFISFLYSFSLFAQTHLEYISEKRDSMALINKTDVDIINAVFNERNTLDSLNTLNEKIILNMNHEIIIQDSIIIAQKQTITNDLAIIQTLEDNNEQTIQMYSKELKKEKNKKISFQATTGAAIIAIILILLL